MENPPVTNTGSAIPTQAAHQDDASDQRPPPTPPSRVIPVKIDRDVPGPETVTEALSDFDNWLKAITVSAVNAADLDTLAVTPREQVLGFWFRQGDLGFGFAPRGVGKTWIAMAYALAIATGGEIGPWKAPKARKVLYVDGEMALDSTKARSAALGGKGVANLIYLHHESLFQRAGMVMNLTNESAQKAILKYCLDNQVEVIEIDNLSCLFTGLKENDADYWELVLPWLLDLRRNSIAVMFIAHAGRNGNMRGTTRREDAAFWIQSFTEVADKSETQTGARFVSRFVKNRNTTEEHAPGIEWTFRTADDGHMIIEWRIRDNLSIFLQYVQDGLCSATDIATEMELSKGMISKLAKKAIALGKIKKQGKDYVWNG